MRILHIIADLPLSGGLSESVPSLCIAEQRQGMDVSLAYTQEREGKNIQYPRRREEQLAVASRSGQLEEGENVEHSTSNIERPTGEGGVREVAFSRSWPRFVYFSWRMLMGLGKEVRAADVVHVHSNWTFPVWWGCWCAWRADKILVMSPRGCLDPIRLKHSAWKKRLVGWMDRWLLQRASVIHVTCEAEKGWVKAFLEPRNPNACQKNIVVIPNGIGNI